MAIFFEIINKYKKDVVLFAIFIIILTPIVIWRQNTLFTEPILPKHFDQTVSVVGVIKREPDIRDTTTRIILSVDFLELKNQKIFLDEKIILTLPIYPERKIGQKIRVTGKIQLPENFQNDNGIEFDYVNFLAKDKIYSLMYRPKIEILADLTEKNTPEFSAGLYILKNIFFVKQRFLEKLQVIIPSPEAELLGGILLGTKRSLGKELEENFRRVGLIHIVVLSGYNVSIIAEAILRFFSFLPKILSATVGAISIFIFAIMVGSGATVIRATIMALLALFARVTGKNYAVNRALFFAGAIMVVHNPMILFHDPSFQLSFLATIGLINLGGIVKKIIKFIPEKFQFREISSATISTQITVLPLLMKMTGELSVVAPVVNIITLQVIPITMLLGFLAGVIAFFDETVGLVAGFLPFLFLKYILLIVNFFAKLSFAVWKF